MFGKCQWLVLSYLVSKGLTGLIIIPPRVKEDQYRQPILLGIIVLLLLILKN